MNRLFLNTVAELREGASVDELGESLQKLVAAVRASGRKGTLTYKIEIKPAAKGSSNALNIEDVITIKEPQAERGSTFLFAAEDNTLSRRDPRQPELTGLRPVTTHPSVSRDATSAAAAPAPEAAILR